MEPAETLAKLIAPCDISAPEFYLIECAAHGAPWSRTSFNDCTGKYYRTQALYVDQKPVGFTICRLVADEVTLMNIAVHPEHQGKGYGALLLKDVLNYASDKQNQPQYKVFLEVRESNRSAIALYRKYGFQDIGRRPGYYPPVPPARKKETAIVMRR
ncbi:ribosomal protein S18-alanine N-acetyltransferase [Aliidiomarina sedimenti]|nr:ribosomal protein S18-alanine N-acetyltransferase [Aliidiomarina sedimenti]